MHLMEIHCLQQVGYLGDVSPVNLDSAQVRSQIVPQRCHVESDHLLAPVHQLADDSVADEAGATGDHYGHRRASCGTGKPSKRLRVGMV